MGLFVGGRAFILRYKIHRNLAITAVTTVVYTWYTPESIFYRSDIRRPK